MDDKAIVRGSGAADTSGVFNYLDASAKSSLYRNGRVTIKRNEDGSDRGMQGVDRSPHSKTVADARALMGKERRTLVANGFELANRPLDESDLDFLDLGQIVQDYYPQCEKLVEEAVGSRAFAFDHNVRSAQGKKSRNRIAGGQPVQEPLHMVHGDYTLTSGPNRLRDLAHPPGRNDTLRTILPTGTSLLSDAQVERALADGGRFAIINVWRNIAREPVATHPLALCDSQTVDPKDLVVFEIHYADRIGENYFAKHADRHRWYFFPAMTPDEALLIKQWDSAGTMARAGGRLADASEVDAPSTFSFHSAFDDPAAPADAPDRKSIEVRCMVLYA